MKEEKERQKISNGGEGQDGSKINTENHYKQKNNGGAGGSKWRELNDDFLSKEEIRKRIVSIKAEEENDSEFAKGWRNGLARLFWELKL